jgi:hypothetical protein
MDTRRRPPDLALARCAALPGMGERAPTATCPSPSSIAAMAAIMISTVLGSPGAGSFGLVMRREF